MPDFLILTHEPGREVDVSDHPIPPLKEVMELHLDLLKPFKDSVFLGMNFLTLKLDEDSALECMSDTQKTFNIPVTDLIRFKDQELVRTIKSEIMEWK